MSNTTEYLDLVPSANRDKAKFIALLTALLSPVVDGKNVALDIINKYDLDQAVGKQLDVIGEWVGQSRTISDNIEFKFFGFDDTPNALPFGEEGNPSIGGRFREQSEPFQNTTTLQDPEYLFAIKAKIARNSTDGRIDSLIDALDFLLGDGVAIVQDFGGMTIYYDAARELTFNEKALIRSGILPKPAGVKLIAGSSFNPSNYFGFEGMTGAKGFGEESDLSIGGIFAEEI